MIGAASSVANAVYVLAIQIAALFMLEPRDFGVFSLAYLAFALTSSVAMSTISEAWLRREAGSSTAGSWRDYAGASMYLSLASGAVALVIFLLVGPLRDVAVVGALAVAASTYRVSARYYVVKTGGPRAGIPGDVIGTVALAVALVGWLLTVGSGLVSIMVAWAVGALASALGTRVPPIQGPAVLVRWVSEHRREVRALLGDSVITNITAIGTPIVLAPILGITRFGIYRALGNVAAPVRLLVLPLAPVIASRPVQSHFGLRWGSMYIGLSLGLGLGAATVLFGIQAADFNVGVLGALSEFWLPAGVFVSANFFGHLTSIIARAHLLTRELIRGRIVQMVFGVSLPIAGAVLFGLSGALWGLAMSATLSSCWWILALARHRA